MPRVESRGAEVSRELAFVIFLPIAISLCFLARYFELKYDRKHRTGSFVELLIGYSAAIFFGLSVACFAILWLVMLLKSIGIIPT